MGTKPFKCITAKTAPIEIAYRGQLFMVSKVAFHLPEGVINVPEITCNGVPALALACGDRTLNRVCNAVARGKFDCKRDRLALKKVLNTYIDQAESAASSSTP